MASLVYSHIMKFFHLQKVKELANMHSEGILSGELKHGPLALIDKDMPIVMVISNDATYDVSPFCLSSSQLFILVIKYCHNIIVPHLDM